MLAMDSPEQETVLVVRAGNRLCALPLKNVNEVARPLPTNSLPGAPPFLRGIAIIRGSAIPVVDLKRLLEVEVPGDPTRFVICRFDARRVALAAEAVPGVRGISCAAWCDLPRITDESSPALIESVRVSDQEMLLMLQVARVIPDSLWKDLEPALATS